MNHAYRTYLPLWIVAIVLTLLLGRVGTVRAHTVFPIHSEPAAGAVLQQAPSHVTIRFKEELLSPQSKFAVIDAAGNLLTLNPGAVDLTDPDHATLVAELPALAAGVYRVRWAITLVDGDASAGEYIFTIGTDTQANPVTANTAISPAEQTNSPLRLWLLGGGGGLLLLGLGLVWRWRG